MKLKANICFIVCSKGYTRLMLLVNGQCQDQIENAYCGRKIIQIIHLYGKLMSKQKHSSEIIMQMSGSTFGSEGCFSYTIL